MAFQKLQKLKASSREYLEIFKNLEVYEERNNQTFLNMTAVQTAVETNVLNGKRGIRDIYGKVDLRGLLSVDEYPEDKFFPCYLLLNQVAWFYTDDNGITRYCTKNRLTKKRLDMDLVDLIAFQTKSYSKASTIRELKETYSYKELELGEIEESRYKENLIAFKEYVQKDSTLFTELDYKIYEAIHFIATDNLFGGTSAVGKRAIFFTSISFIQENLFRHYELTVPKVTVASKINWFATIGLIEKVSEDKIPKGMLEIAANKFEEKKISSKARNKISYYQIRTFSEQIKNMEKVSASLIKYGLSYDKISKQSIARLISLPLANEVYPTITTKKKEFYEKEKVGFIEQFYLLLKKNGYVKKEDLNHLLNKNLVNKLWTALTKQTIGVSKKLTKQLRDLLDVTGTGAVFISHSILAPFCPVVREEEEDETIEIIEEETIFIANRCHEPNVRMWGGG